MRVPWVKWVVSCDWRGVELILASWAIFWGLWLLAPWWVAFSSSPTFAAMLAIANEEAWGATPVALGLILLIGLRRQSRSMRRWGLMGLTLMWLAFWAALAIGNWRSTATPVYIHLVLLCAMCYLRLHRAQH